MPDYESYPLWWADDSDVGDIDPATLPLSADLIDRLEQWADAYDATLNPDDPLASGFANAEAEANFEAEGRSLWQQLQEQLKPDYQVVYYSYQANQLFTQPNEMSA